MLRLFLSLALCFSSFAFGQGSSADVNQPLASAVQIVYVIDGSTLTTYNIDPSTLQPTQVGTTALVESVYPGLVASPNGHFIYYTAYQDLSQQGETLYVYNTNASGVPLSTPAQTLSAKGVYSLRVDPAAKFLYLVRQGTAGPQFTPYAIVRMVIDANTGRLSQPVVEAQYQLDSGTGGGQLCSLSILGMNAAGTKMYDEVFCSYFGGNSATYNERTVDAQTGALGPDQQVYSWNNDTEGAEYVQFVKNLVFDFIIPNNYDQGVNVVNVYPLQPNVTNPIINCTASMLAACGNDNGLAHPSAQYVFMLSSQLTTEIDKVDLSAKQIEATGSTIPYYTEQFSPDGSIVYAVNDINGALNIEIYGFDVSNAAVKAGGVINAPSDLDSWFTAVRHY